MKQIIPFAVAAILVLFFEHARNGGFGKIGEKIRSTDRDTLEDAIFEKKRELFELENRRSQF